MQNIYSNIPIFIRYWFNTTFVHAWAINQFCNLHFIHSTTILSSYLPHFLSSIKIFGATIRIIWVHLIGLYVGFSVCLKFKTHLSRWHLVHFLRLTLVWVISTDLTIDIDRKNVDMQLSGESYCHSIFIQRSLSRYLSR